MTAEALGLADLGIALAAVRTGTSKRSDQPRRLGIST